MPYDYLNIASTPGVRQAQAANGSADLWSSYRGDRQSARFTEAEIDFIARRDSFYMATVSESGWPYVQHRGGPAGFLRVVDAATLAFADFRGNRQYISLGNMATNDRAALIVMDYPGRRRLKIYGHIAERSLADDPKLSELLAMPGYKGRPERAMVLRLDAFDWNCPQHITPRFTESEVAEAMSPVTLRIESLEAENKLLREKLANQGGSP